MSDSDSNKRDKTSLELLKEFHGKERVESYLSFIKDENHLEDAYYLNQKVILFFTPLLSEIEILLRNKMVRYFNEAKSKVKGSENITWYDFVASKNYRLKQHIYRAICKIIAEESNEKNKEKVLNNLETLFVSRVSFGFWTYVLKEYIALEDGVIFMKEVFNISDEDIEKYDAVNKINEQIFSIKKFRNRCSHHECLIKEKHHVVVTYANILSVITSLTTKKYRKEVVLKVNSLTCTRFKQIDEKLLNIVEKRNRCKRDKR